MIKYIYHKIKMLEMEGILCHGIIETIIVVTIVFLGAFPIIFAALKANKDSEKDILSAEDFKKNKHTHMDIISKISPTVISYIDNMKFDYSKTVTAALLVLRMNDFIKFGRDSIIILKEELEVKASKIGEIEKYIFSCIRNGQVFASKRDLNDMVINEAIKQNLLENNTYDKLHKRLKNIKKIFMIVVCLYILQFFVNELKPVAWFAGVFLIVSAIAAFIYLVFYNANEYQRTEYGKEINRRIEGLKNYINEYSLLEEKDPNAIEIWDEFYIYHAIFQKSRIIIIDHLKYIRIKPR